MYINCLISKITIVFFVAIIQFGCNENDINKNYSDNLEVISVKFENLIQSIEKYKKDYGKYPETLDVLVNLKYIKSIPKLDDRKFFSFGDKCNRNFAYTLKTYESKEYFIISTMLVGGLSSDIDIYYLPISDFKIGFLPTSQPKWSSYKKIVRFNKNWVYCR